MVVNEEEQKFDENGCYIPRRVDYHLLECDECGKEICMVHDMDLNGTYFCCFDCFKADKLLNQGRRR